MKRSLLFLTLLAASLTSAHALDLGVASSYTPYDRYMTPVKSVLGSVGAEKASMERAAKLMRVGRSFRYVHSTPYLPADPAQTAARRAGDCKDKALWLCEQLGDPSARFVIGKVSRFSRASHAWVMWENAGRWWILDPTLTSRPIAADRIRQDNYVPLYSYGKRSAYRHARTVRPTARVTPAMPPVAAKTAAPARLAKR